MSANDNVHKEEENACGVALSEPGSTEKRVDEEERESSEEGLKISLTPNKYNSDAVMQDIEIEARESYQLKQSLGI